MGKGGRKNRRRADFHYRVDDEPHAKRRTEILKKYPEVKKLYGFEPLTKYIAGATVFMQLALAIFTRHLGWAKWLGVIYCVGATANHSLFLAIHELAHNLGAKTINGNKYIAMMANIPICIAYSVTFKPYHMAHHRNQGVEGVDTDIPSAIEGLLVTGTALNYWDHTARKAIFMFFQIFGYALRPMFTKPDLVPVDKWIILNWLVCLTCDAALVAAFGPAPLFYLLLSTFFAGSIHPTAGHFIAEHYVMDGTAETYSYYGVLNYLTYNVGFHNEHHDFPAIPWSRLPLVRKIAPEYYDDLPQCASWPGTILRYIFDDSISPYSRMKKDLSAIKAD